MALAAPAVPAALAQVDAAPAGAPHVVDVDESVPPRRKVIKGRLPSRPELTHGWAQLRIGAQAIRGGSAVSSGEWSCPA